MPSIAILRISGFPLVQPTLLTIRARASYNATHHTPPVLWASRALASSAGLFGTVGWSMIALDPIFLKVTGFFAKSVEYG